MKVTIPTNIRHTGKDPVILELTLLLAQYKVDRVLDHLTDDFCWFLVGDEPICGKEKFGAALTEMAGNKATELTIDGVVTHGNQGAVHGEVTMQNGAVYGFSDMYAFSNAHVKSITSYVIQKKEPKGNEAC